MRLESNRSRIALALVIALIAVSALLGVIHSAGSTSATGQGTCPFMPGVVICNMTPMQHIAAAQSMFNAFVQIDFSTFVLLLLSLLLAAVISKLRPLLKPRFVQASVFVSVQIFESPRFALQEAYSRGILNPKLF